jgi:hypothetical protein
VSEISSQVLFSMRYKNTYPFYLCVYKLKFLLKKNYVSRIFLKYIIEGENFLLGFFRLLGCFTAYGGFKPTFSLVRLTLEDGTDRQSRNSGSNHLTPRNNTEDGIIRLDVDGSL